MVENTRRLGKARSALAEKTQGRSLKKRTRWGEEVIRSMLLFCGIISVFTTIGIVVTLGSQSRLLFTQDSLLDSNHRVREAMTTDQNELVMSAGGLGIEAGDRIRIGQEVMRVESISEADEESGTKTLVVERGLEDTVIAEHSTGGDISLVQRVTIREFFGGTRWQPQIGQFGIWPLLNATLLISGIAMLVSVPIGLGTAIYVSEYASERVRGILKPILELLAGVPTVVYGYFALTFVTPLLRLLLGRDTVEIFNMASAGIVVGILIIPTISSISEDALHAVPDNLRQASYGLGATKYETATKVLVPAAFSGIVASFILGLSRAVGETMIVAIAAGAGPDFTFNPFVGAETITGHIVRISTGDISYQSVDYNSLFALGLTLFIITLILNIISGIVARRYREVYQ